MEDVEKTTDKLIKNRKKKYMNMKKQQLTSPDANRSFFRLAKAFNTPEKARLSMSGHYAWATQISR